MGDTFALEESLDRIKPTKALIVGAGYVGLEMAEGLTARGIEVTQVEMLDEVLPTVDPELGGLVHARAGAPRRHRPHGRSRHPHRALRQATTICACSVSRGRARASSARAGTPTWSSSSSASVQTPICSHAPGQRPASGAPSLVDERMATGLPHVWAAGRLRGHSPPPSRHHLPPARAPPPTSRAASPGRTPSVGTRRSPAASAPRSSRCSTSSPHVPGSASTKPSLPGYSPRHHPEQPGRPQGLLPGRAADHHPRHRRHRDRTPPRRATGRAPAAPRPPSASTPTPRRCSTA